LKIPSEENAAFNWQAIEKTPRFQELHRTKSRFLSCLMCFALIYFFCLPISTAYFQSILTIKIWGVMNIGLLFALSQFVIAWGIAIIYAKRANHHFDQQAKAIIQETFLNEHSS
jgi:uncharacterized membrane protein (DUF485 family)